MDTALERRIRRHVIGKPHAFFAATAPGLEELCLSELRALGLQGRATAGGVEFSGRLPDGYRANLHLRTANRILMRACSFQSIHFTDLERQAAEWAWELFLWPGSLDKIHVTTHRCRLHHTDAIGLRVRAGIERRIGPPGITDRPCIRQNLFVRGVRDRFTVSIDSSGENLYLRRLKSHPGSAPLRETLAAAVLTRAGFTGAEALLDPMCGTGSFSLEAALIAKNVPPGWFREFAFKGWPGFRPQAWEYLRRKAAEKMVLRQRPSVFASDVDPAACSALESTLRKHGLSDAVNVACLDFFDLDPGKIAAHPGIIILNPPYGRRLGSPMESRQLRRAIMARIGERYRGWKFILLAPDGSDPPVGGFPVNAYFFRHGGLRVRVAEGRVPPG